MRSLFERGEPTRYTKARDELRFIGLPVGGVGCGMLYLAGDGRLWLWDIFNTGQEGVIDRSIPWSDTDLTFAGSPGSLIRPRDGAAYVWPHEAVTTLEQGFGLRITRGGTSEVRTLDAGGFSDVEFIGQYPVGTVEYRDPQSAVRARLEAFSPFAPLALDDSSLPATVMRISITNESAEALEVELAGWLENQCSRDRARAGSGRRSNQVVRSPGCTSVVMSFDAAERVVPDARPDITLAAFEGGDYSGWRATGDAFGVAPIRRAAIPSYQGDVGGRGDGVVNSHSSAPGASIPAKDARVGTLTSPPFRVERRFLSFFIGGGRDPSKLGLRLRIDGEVVRSAAGRDDNAMRLDSFDVREFEGHEATLEIVDEATGGWGNVGVDHIVLTDTPAVERPNERDPDWGTLAFALAHMAGARVEAVAARTHADGREATFDDAPSEQGEREVGAKTVGVLRRTFTLPAGATETVSFVIAWHFRNVRLPVPDSATGREYAGRFADAHAVARHVVARLDELTSSTFLWRDTWHDSTLPHWFLERTFANTSTLATTTFHRFASGRSWGWEGIGCCEGTCTHVWHYAQAPGRVFPALERDLRERIDFGVALDVESGRMGHRGENTGPAVDGQAGRILGVYREHAMSSDAAFLRRVWPNVRRATEWLLAHDTDGDGLLDGAQENTLDAAWFGKIAWTSSLFLAALRAASTMASELGDGAFARACEERVARGKRSIERELWNGEHFVHLPEKDREGALGTYSGCHIDQVLGEAWLAQLALEPVLDRERVRTALQALYRYNFAPDVGAFRTKNREGRPYALAGDGGLVMTTNPKGLAQPFGEGGWQYGYFNECMSGFEHQAAAHMIAVGLTQEGLSIVRAIHDRYHARMRNPWNEVECSDHYARAMASFGAFVAISGFEHHGTRKHLGFTPRMPGWQFRCAFIACSGWGTFEQHVRGDKYEASIALRAGSLELESLRFGSAAHVPALRAVLPDGSSVELRPDTGGTLRLPRTCVLGPGAVLRVGSI